MECCVLENGLYAIRHTVRHAGRAPVPMAGLSFGHGPMIGQILGLMFGLLLALAALLASPRAAFAQYDSQGRYVPSPMGKPSDPYRSYVPGYTGKPGGTKGLSTTPPAYQIKPAQAPAAIPMPKPATPIAPLMPMIHPTLEQCQAGWSKDFAMPRVRFNRACNVILREHRKQVEGVSAKP